MTRNTAAFNINKANYKLNAERRKERRIPLYSHFPAPAPSQQRERARAPFYEFTSAGRVSIYYAGAFVLHAQCFPTWPPRRRSA
jgi:hypothetical protein